MDGSEPVLAFLCQAAMEPIEEADADVLLDVIATCRDIIDRAETALRSWGPT